MANFSFLQSIALKVIQGSSDSALEKTPVSCQLQILEIFKHTCSTVVSNNVITNVNIVFKKSLFLTGAKIFQNLKSVTSSCLTCTICCNLYTSQIIFYSLNIS